MLPNAPDSCKVFTPGPLAEAIVRRLHTEPNLTWLEPCVGSGVFIEKLNAQGVPKTRITCIDLDRKPQPLDKYAETIRGKDFLRWCRCTELRFDRIVANPPFLSIKQLPELLQSSALTTQGVNGEKVTLGANCWYAFLCASLHLLKPNGCLAFILPAAWDYATYAFPVRATIHSMFRKIEVHRSLSPMFDNVHDGAVVLFADGFRQPPLESRRTEHATAERLIAFLSGEERTKRKSVRRTKSTGQVGKRLAEIIDIRIGIVTGDAKFFVLSEEQRIAKGLPMNCLKPVLSRARHLIASELSEAKWRDLRKRGERIWLFYPAKGGKHKKAVSRYLRLSLAKGGCNRKAYKVRNRESWFLPQIVQNCDGFVSGMSTVGPWICFSDMRSLSATNTLYVVKFRESLTMNQKCAWALALLTTAVRQSLKAKCRRYADGLEKYEPSDLSELVVPQPPVMQNARFFYRLAIEALLQNDEKGASAIADQCFGTI